MEAIIEPQGTIADGLILPSAFLFLGVVSIFSSLSLQSMVELTEMTYPDSGQGVLAKIIQSITSVREHRI